MIPLRHFDPPKDSRDAPRRVMDQLWAAWRAEVLRRELVLEDFLISGAMPRDIAQVVQVLKPPRVQTYVPGGQVLVDPIGEDWRVN